MVAREGNISPHEDPFKIPLNLVKSTPKKKMQNNSNEIGILQQPDLRYIKPYRDFDYGSFSDGEMLSRGDGSVYEVRGIWFRLSTDMVFYRQIPMRISRSRRSVITAKGIAAVSLVKGLKIWI